jgi:hypothetical protein
MLICRRDADALSDLNATVRPLDILATLCRFVQGVLGSDLNGDTSAILTDVFPHVNLQP